MCDERRIVGPLHPHPRPRRRRTSVNPILSPGPTVSLDGLAETRLTPTSYIVLGLLEAAGAATPYDLKQRVAATLGNFWSLQHAQLYSEPQRLTAAGLLRERREEGGRRRRVYSLTDQGRSALATWRETPTSQLSQMREPALLKLFLGADPASIAPAQLEAHRRKLAEYEALREHDPGNGPRGPWLTLEAGIEHEHVWVEFWQKLAKKETAAGRTATR